MPELTPLDLVDDVDEEELPLLSEKLDDLLPELAPEPLPARADAVPEENASAALITAASSRECRFTWRSCSSVASDQSEGLKK